MINIGDNKIRDTRESGTDQININCITKDTQLHHIK